MDIFLNTVSITSGILLPPVLIIMIFAVYIIIKDSIQYRTAKAERDAEKYKKLPPFDDKAEFYEVPNPNMIGVKLMKDGVVVWKGATYREGKS